MNPVKWTETRIATVLARNTFRRQLVVVPNCLWTGHECDLLVVTERCMLIDVEVKISRADLKADAKKEKWWENRSHFEFRHSVGAAEGPPAPRMRREWPPKVWKHYYAMPREIWSPDLLTTLGSPASGVILLGSERYRDQLDCYVEKRPKPNTGAEPISGPALVDICRLASVRMWSAFDRLAELKAGNP